MSAAASQSTRWVQLMAGVLAMVSVANFQYAWTLFVRPLENRHGWTNEQIQYAYSFFFLLSQTWLVPLEAYLADRFGPRRLVVAGGLLTAIAWTINAGTDSLAVLYLAQVISGCGAGIVYGISMGNALKWFPDRRGLAAGLTAAAFGAGSAATVLPISLTIKQHGFEAAFLWFGLAQGLIIVLAGLVLRFPRLEDALPSTSSRLVQSGRDYTPRDMLATPAFWLLYVMMTVGAVPGLLMIGQMAKIARDFGVEEVPVTLFGLTLAALPFALMLDRIMGGLTRPLFGWFSDHIGRERAIFLAFALEGTSLFFLYRYRHDPVWFVLTSGVAFFGWGAVFSLFPAVSGDMFGRQYATTNYAILYTAKGAAALLVTLANHVQASTGDWSLIFLLMIALDGMAALLALLVLPWMRRR